MRGDAGGGAERVSVARVKSTGGSDVAQRRPAAVCPVRASGPLWEWSAERRGRGKDSPAGERSWAADVGAAGRGRLDRRAPRHQNEEEPVYGGARRGRPVGAGGVNGAGHQSFWVTST